MTTRAAAVSGIRARPDRDWRVSRGAGWGVAMRAAVVGLTVSAAFCVTGPGPRAGGVAGPPRWPPTRQRIFATCRRA